MGIRIPHLHFRGDIYFLSEEQWKGFSGKVVKDFQAKLAKGRALPAPVLKIHGRVGGENEIKNIL